MNGTILAQGLMTASSNELRTIYALLAETKLTSLVAVKAKELFKKDIDHFNELLQNEIKKLDIYSDDELRLKLLVHFTKILDLNGGAYHLSEEIEQKSEEIILHTHELMLKDKDYEQFVSNSAQANISQLIVHYQMQKIFSVFDTTLKSLDVEETVAFTANIEQILLALPIEQQQALMQKLQLDNLTSVAIHHALLTQGTVVVLSAIVEISGFTAYTALTSAIATSAALTGLAVPVGIYTGAASLLFIVTNPFFLLTLAVGGGGWLLYSQTKKLRQALLPIGVLQLILPVLIDEQHTQIDYTPLLKEWQKKVELQNIYAQKAQEARATFELLKATIASYNTKIDSNTRKMSTFKAQLQQLKMTISEQLSLLPEQEKSATFNELTTQIDTTQAEVERLRVAIATNKGKTGLLKSISRFFDNTALHSTIDQLESQQRQLTKKRLQETINMAPATLTDLLHELTHVQLEIDTLENNIIEQKQQKAQINKQMEALKTTIYELEVVIKKQQKEYHGLENVLPKSLPQ